MRGSSCLAGERVWAFAEGPELGGGACWLARGAARVAPTPGRRPQGRAPRADHLAGALGRKQRRARREEAAFLSLGPGAGGRGW